MAKKLEKRAPDIRFKGFTDDWEQRKLKELAVINPKAELPDKFEYVDLEAVVGTQLIHTQKVTKESAPSRAQRLAKYGDIFYQTVRPYQKNNLLFTISNTQINYVFSTGYAQLRARIDKMFLFSVLQKQNFVDKVLNKSTGTSYPAINSKDLGNIKEKFPNATSEQHKIGKSIKIVDNLIVLQHKKLEQLRLLKKAMLQQLFPDKDGKLQSRFNGFTNVWEQRKLGEMVEFIGTGKSKYKHKNVGAYKILGSTGVVGFDNTYDYNGNYILTARVGANAGTLYKYSGKVKITDNTVFIQGTQLNFTYYLLNNFNLKRLSFGSGQPLIKASELKKLKLYFPIVLEEKEKIGMALSKLDTLIARHQRKLDHLQLLKKFHLQKMFI